MERIGYTAAMMIVGAMFGASIAMAVNMSESAAYVATCACATGVLAWMCMAWESRR